MLGHHAAVHDHCLLQVVHYHQARGKGRHHVRGEQDRRHEVSDGDPIPAGQWNFENCGHWNEECRVGAVHHANHEAQADWESTDGVQHGDLSQAIPESPSVFQGMCPRESLSLRRPLLGAHPSSSLLEGVAVDGVDADDYGRRQPPLGTLLLTDGVDIEKPTFPVHWNLVRQTRLVEGCGLAVLPVLKLLLVSPREPTEAASGLFVMPVAVSAFCIISIVTLVSVLVSLFATPKHFSPVNDLPGVHRRAINTGIG
mmetsp:Transcript_12866/g.38896  ORF Transcript_12866/g.38896 Transcript_12866/m.38896 type:complete len:255 (+) Transcript_12866:1220-1984(+)